MCQNSKKKERNHKIKVYNFYVRGRYDIEPEQNENKLAVRALPGRVRFYHAKIDAEALKTGESYDMLKKVYVIFIMPFDPFGCDRMI